VQDLAQYLADAMDGTTSESAVSGPV